MSKCWHPLNSYKFVYDGETYIADNCSTNYYGYSYCEKDGITYNNVEYKTIFIECLDKQKDKEFEESLNKCMPLIYLIGFCITLYFIVLIYFSLKGKDKKCQ